MMQGQDFQDVVIRKRAPKQADLKDAGAVNAARQAGHSIETERRANAGSNKSGSAQAKSAAKLDAETEDFHHTRVSSQLKTQIVQARTAKKLTQAQLAQTINEKPQVIQEYESGKAIPNPQVLSKLSRVLGVHLKR